jgi:hypothetical protein
MDRLDGRIDNVANEVNHLFHERVDLDEFFTNQSDIVVPQLSTKNPYIEECYQVKE